MKVSVQRKMFTENICGQYNRLSEDTIKLIVEQFQRRSSLKDDRLEKYLSGRS